MHENAQPTEQTRNKKTIGVPKIALMAQLQKIPRAAVKLAFFVSSATWPEASKPVKQPDVNRKERSQFQPVGAPVPL